MMATMTKEKRAARAKKWKRTIYEDVAFPSGAKADIQKPRMMTLITQDGNIPNKFFAAMFGTGQEKQAQLQQMKPDEQAEYMRTMMYLANQIALAAFVSPTIISDGEAAYENDEIHIDDLEDEDKEFLMEWAMSGGEPDEALARFLAAQQTKRLDAAPPS